MNYEKSCCFNCLFPYPLHKQTRLRIKHIHMFCELCISEDAVLTLVYPIKLQKPLSNPLTCVTFCPPCPRGQSHSHEPEWWRCTPSAVRSPPGRGPSAGPRQTSRSAPLPRMVLPARGCWTHRFPLVIRKTRRKGGGGERERGYRAEYIWRMNDACLSK